jgi:FlaA1/EpsC-like NDP-sugar epimerase
MISGFKNIKNWFAGLFFKNKYDQVNDISYDLLLNRKFITYSKVELTHEFTNEVVMITGAAGYIGQEICHKLIPFKCKKLILLDIAETPLFELELELIQLGYKNYEVVVSNITDINHIDKLFNYYKPKIVFHAAAYKHVPVMENNAYAAVKTNALGTKYLADISIKYGINRFIFISSDKAVNPTNVMGATKRVGEMYLQCLKGKGRTEFITTRFGNVIGSSGSAVPLFQKQIKCGGPITITHEEMTRYFMTVSEACQLVLESSVMGLGGEIFTFDMGHPVKIYDLAKRMINLYELRFPQDIDIKITGLRPGEKLKEELLVKGENLSSTNHEKILISKSIYLDFNHVESKIKYLDEHIEELQTIEIVALLKEIVPEYISNNSTFEILDN